MGAGRGPEAPEDSEAVDPAGAPDAGGEDLPTPSEVFRGSMAHTGDAYFRRLPLVIAILTLFVAGIVAQFVIDLRHQYLLAFESSAQAGWHRLSVLTRKRDLQVRARSGYIARGEEAGAP